MGAAPLLGTHDTICIFHNGYFGYRGAFQTVLDSYCCITAVKDVQWIEDNNITRVCAAIPFDAECIGNIIICKKTEQTSVQTIISTILDQ